MRALVLKPVLALGLLLGGFSASATSLNPCTPMIRAQPTIMACQSQAGAVSIRIETLMSDRKLGCNGASYYEYQTAHLQMENGSELTIGNGDFSYTLDLEGSTFTSPKHQIDLRDCVTPMHGGVSFSNGAQR